LQMKDYGVQTKGVLARRKPEGAKSCCGCSKGGGLGREGGRGALRRIAGVSKELEVLGYYPATL